MEGHSPPPAPPPRSVDDARRRRRQAERARRLQIRRRRLVAVTGLVVIVVAVVAAISSGGGRIGPTSSSQAGGSTRPAKRSRPVTITVEAAGDLLIHSPVWDAALALGGGNRYDFAPLFAKIRPYIRHTDLPLCHMETPMTPRPPTGFPVFNTPPALASAIHQTGWLACSTAATHTLDQGQVGVDDTIRALDRVGVLHAGSYASAAASHKPLIMHIKGVPVAFLSYTELTNGIPSPHPWSVHRANAGEILADAQTAHRDGAKVVVVNIHWGDENVPAPSMFQLRLADRLTRSPYITAIVGQHVHVPQPIRRINGKLVVFGTGNLISNQTSACCPTASQDGLLALLTIVVDQHGARVTVVHYVPIWVSHPSFVVLPAGPSIRSDPTDAAALRASYERTVATVGRSRYIRPVPWRLGG